MSKTRKVAASTYLYDPLDRLRSTKDNTTRRFYNETRIATEIEGERQSRFFEADSQPLAVQQHGASPGTTLLATDQQTSVLNGANPDGSQQAQAYSAFGYHPAGGALNAAGFNGERPEPVTGHYLLGQGYRAFNPVLMRFNSPDSWSPFGDGGINAYAYCDNNPSNKVDPTGHLAEFIKTILRPLGIINSAEKTTKILASQHDEIKRLANTLGKGDSDFLPRNSALDKLSKNKLLNRSATTYAKAHDNLLKIDKINSKIGSPPTSKGLLDRAMRKRARTTSVSPFAQGNVNNQRNFDSRLKNQITDLTKITENLILKSERFQRTAIEVRDSRLGN